MMKAEYPVFFVSKYDKTQQMIDPERKVAS
jgi:hypothetical protein